MIIAFVCESKNSTSLRPLLRITVVLSCHDLYNTCSCEELE